MKLLIDVGVGVSVEDWLSQQGHDVLSIRAVNPQMSDKAILALASRDQRIVITMDKDFGELVFQAGQDHGGVLLLRLDEADSEGKVRVVSQLFAQHAHEFRGRFAVYSNGRLRIR